MLLGKSQAFWQQDTGIMRTHLAEVEKAKDIPHAVIVSGLRRAGKSTLLAQMSHPLGEDQFSYINFEDHFLGFLVDDATDLYQVLIVVFGE